MRPSVLNRELVISPGFFINFKKFDKNEILIYKKKVSIFKNPFNQHPGNCQTY